MGQPNPQPQGGSVLGSIQVVPIIWGNSWPYDAASPLSGQLLAFLQFFVGADNPELQQIREYSVGSAAIGPGAVVNNKMITAPGQPPPSLTDRQIGLILAGWNGTPGFPSWDPNTVYMLFLPQGVSVTTNDGLTSCQPVNSFQGYHSAYDSQHYYIVVPCCVTPPTPYNQVFSALTSICSHELCETITNPFGDTWVDESTNPTTEICDFCQQFGTGSVADVQRASQYQVQSFWSQLQQSCVFGPPVKVIGLGWTGVIIGGASFGGVLTLSSAAPLFPSAAVIISLTSDNPAVTITTPTIQILPGAFNAVFQANSSPVAQATVVSITATLGSQVFTQQVTVLPPSIAEFSYSPAAGEGYQYPPNAPQGSLTLNEPAPASGLIVGVTSSEHLLVVPIPDELPIAAGALSPAAPFYLQVNPAGVTTPVTLTADVAGTSTSFTFKVLAGGPSNITVKQLTLTPSKVSGGRAAIGRFTLAAAVGPAGGNIVVESSDPSIATVPATVTLNSGAMGGSFQIHTKARPAGSPQKTITIMAGKDGNPVHAILTVD